MPLPLLTRYADVLRYDSVRGVLLTLDWQHYPQNNHLIECADADAVVAAMPPTAIYGTTPTTLLAGYALVLTARQHRHWPTDAQRSALIQTATRLRSTRPLDAMGNAFLDTALEHADTALLRGSNAEHALTNWLAAQMTHSDELAEACGRHAANLVEDGACLLVHGFPGAALNWMLHTAHIEQGKYVRLYVTETRPLLQGTRLTAYHAHTIGTAVTLITDNMPGLYFSQDTFTAFVAAAEYIARDGSIAARAGTYSYAVLANYHNVPFYALGAAGPNPELATAADVGAECYNPNDVLYIAGVRTAGEGVAATCPVYDITPPERITAIVTARGVFTPQQMATYHEIA